MYLLEKLVWFTKNMPQSPLCWHLPQLKQPISSWLNCEISLLYNYILQWIKILPRFIHRPIYFHVAHPLPYFLLSHLKRTLHSSRSQITVRKIHPEMMLIRSVLYPTTPNPSVPRNHSAQFLQQCVCVRVWNPSRGNNPCTKGAFDLPTGGGREGRGRGLTWGAVSGGTVHTGRALSVLSGVRPWKTPGKSGGFGEADVEVAGVCFRLARVWS